MKKSIFAAGTLLLAMLFSLAIQAQPVDIDNRTPCTFIVKVNVVPAPTCPFTGFGPVVVAPGPAVTTIPDPTGIGTWIPGYGIHEAIPGTTPTIVRAPGCGPPIIPIPPSASFGCPGAVAEYLGHTLIIH